MQGNFKVKRIVANMSTRLPTHEESSTTEARQGRKKQPNITYQGKKMFK